MESESERAMEVHYQVIDYKGGKYFCKNQWMPWLASIGEEEKV